MARQLGTLTLDLVAKIGGFTQGMNEAERVADRKSREIAKKQKQRAKEVEEAWRSISNAVAGAFAGYSLSSAIQKVAQETRNFQNEQAQLAAVLKSTGNAAGFTQKQLNDMAASMEGRSIFSAGEINQAQARLLSYSGIVGEEFPRAMQAAIDMATRMGMDVSSAAETVGRALDSPKDGLTALQKQGFRFTEDQKALVTQLQEAGKSAQAQSIVLQALESSYGGAAEAARDTFGGAIAGLQNQLNSLLTGESGSFDAATKAINDLTRNLASTEVQEAFAKLTGWVADLISGFVSLTANMTAFLGQQNKLATFFGQDEFGQMTKEAKLYADQLEQSSKRIEQLQQALANEPGSERRSRALEDERKRWSNLQRQLQAATGALKGFGAVAPKTDPSEFAFMDSRVTRGVPDASGAAAAAAARKKAADEAARMAKQQQTQAEQYLKQLKEQLVKTQDLTAFERLMYDIKEGNVVLAGKQLDQAEGLATAIDMAREREAQRSLEIDRQNALYEAQNALASRRNQYELELLTYGMGNRQAAELRERIALMQQYQAQITKLEQDRALALAGADTEAEISRIQSMYDARLEIVRDTLSQELALHEQAIEQRRMKEADWQAGAISGLRTYLEESRDVYSQMQQTVLNAFGALEDTVYDFVTTGKLDLGDMLRSIAEDVIRMLIRVGAQMLANKILGETLQAAGVASAAAAAAATATAWAPAAAMASLASFGGNAGPAMAGMTATAGLAQTLALTGFADGGFTGHGGKFQPAGIVHKGEGVLSQEDMSALGGPAAFERFRSSLHRGYASGGVVGLPPAAARRSDNDIAREPIVQIIENPARAREVEYAEDENGDEVIRVFVADLGSGGKASKALEATYGLRRRGR